jgi:CheY-like chemotaxis protein
LQIFRFKARLFSTMAAPTHAVRRQILIVDDDALFSARLRTALEKQGYDVEEASDGGAALALLEKKREGIHLVIADLAIPEINGFELIGHLTRRANAIKVIAMTAVYKQPYLDLTLQLGAHAVLRKPEQGAPIPQDWLHTIDLTLATQYKTA